MKPNRRKKIKIWGISLLLLFLIGLPMPRAHAIIDILVTGALWDNSDSELIRREILLPDPIKVSGQTGSDAFRGVGYKGLPVLRLLIPSTEVYWNLNLSPEFLEKYGIDYPYAFLIPKTNFTTYESGEHEFTELKDRGVAKVNANGEGNTDPFADHTYHHGQAGPGGATHALHPIALIYSEIPPFDDGRYYPFPYYHRYAENSWYDVINDRYKDSLFMAEYGYLKANLAYGSDYQAFQDYLKVIDGEASEMPFLITTEKIHFSNNDPGDNVFEDFADWLGSIFGDDDQNYILRFVVRGVVGPDDQATQTVHLKGGTIVSKLSFTSTGALSPRHFIGQFGPPPTPTPGDDTDQEVHVHFQGTLISYGPTDLQNYLGSNRLPNSPTQQISKMGEDGIYNPTHLPDVKDSGAEPSSPVGVYHIRN